MDRDVVFTLHKRILLREGKVAPKLYIDCEDNCYTIPINSMPDDEFAKAVFLFNVGRTFARSEYQTLTTLKELCLITEMWFNQHTLEEPLSTEDIATIKSGNLPEHIPIPDTRPSQSPACREGLAAVFLHYTKPHITQEVYIAEILRTKDNKIHDLLPLGKSDLTIGKLLYYVIRSFPLGGSQLLYLCST